MHTIIKFDKQPWRLSLGRNRYMKTGGIEIFDQRRPAPFYENCDDAVLLNPLTSRGNSTEACRIAIAREALPQIIRVLQKIASTYDRECDCEGYGEYATGAGGGQ